VAVGGLTVGRGVAPQLWTAHPRGPSQNIPIRASKGMIFQISGRSDSVGGGAFPQWFSQPPYYLFELFALEGFICLAHFGWLPWPPSFELERGLLTAGTPSPSPFDKTNCALDYDSPLGFAVILSSRRGKAGLWVDFRGSFLRWTELIKRSLLKDDKPMWWCLEPLQFLSEQQGRAAVATPVPGRRFPDRLLVGGYKATWISASVCRRLSLGHYDGVAARHPQVGRNR